MKTMDDFNNLFVAPMFGFECGKDLSRRTSSIHRKRDIRTPLFILLSEDDALVGLE